MTSYPTGLHHPAGRCQSGSQRGATAPSGRFPTRGPSWVCIRNLATGCAPPLAHTAPRYVALVHLERMLSRCYHRASVSPHPTRGRMLTAYQQPKRRHLRADAIAAQGPSATTDQRHTPSTLYFRWSYQSVSFRTTSHAPV